MPRYLPVQLDAAIPEVKRVYAEVQERLGVVPNFLKTVAHNDRLLEPVAKAYLGPVGGSSLSEKLRLLMIVKACRLDKCQQTASWHEQKAREAGVTDEQLAAIDDYAASDTLSFYEKEAMRLVELVRSTPDEISTEFWTQLDNHYTSDQVVEMILLIGFCGLVNRFVLAVGVDADKRGN